MTAAKMVWIAAKMVWMAAETLPALRTAMREGAQVAFVEVREAAAGMEWLRAQRSTVEVLAVNAAGEITGRGWV